MGFKCGPLMPPGSLTSTSSFFWPYHVACGISVPQPGIEPVPHTLKARSLNYWTAREVQTLLAVIYMYLNTSETTKIFTKEKF